MSEEQVEQKQEEEIAFTVVDDTAVSQTTATVDSDDELDKYTKNVSKRINNLNKKTRQAEERALQAERLLAQKDAENQQLKAKTSQLTSNVLVAEEQSIQAKEQQADELYKKAVSSGDADLMSKADTLKSDLSIQKEKLRIAKNRQVQEPEVAQQTVQAPQQQVQQQVQPSDSALAWKGRNNWYNQPEHKEESDYAMYQHYVLENEGYIADTDDYWNELDTRVRKVFPNLEESEKTAEKNDAKPTVQRVASTSVGSRQKTQAKKGGVTFTKSEQARLRALKPHKMSEDEWFKRVAKEKQKISQQREVS
jgi:hypothetical protein|tara:strand:+ start:3615 stop:4538 length:924 start_codon:yes stop_codon:yes gene_type:complete